MTNALIKELRSPATLLLAIGLFFFEVSISQHLVVDEFSNLWDVLVPVTSDSHFLVLAVLLWWVNLLMQTGRDMLSDLTLIRFGSRFGFLKAALKSAGLSLIAAVAILSAVALPMAARVGLSWQWSPAATLVIANQGLDVFSAAAAAQYFEIPIQAMALNLGYCALAFLGLATLYFALWIVGKVQVANGFVTATYLWAAACSFGVASTIPAFDAVNLFDLSWALNQGVAWQVGAFWISAAILAGLMVNLRFGLKSSLTLATRFGGLVLVAVLAFALAWAKSGSNFGARWGSLFAGQNDSLVGYCSIQLLLYFLASVNISKFLEAIAADRLHWQIRLGSHQKIIARQLLRLVLMALVGAVAIVFATTGAFVLSGIHLDSAASIAVVVETAFGLWLTLVMVSCIGYVAVAVTQAMQTWFWLVAAFSVAGYTAFLPLGNFDIFALYSSSRELRPASLLPGFISATVIVALSVGALFAMKSRQVVKSLKIASQWIG